MPRITDTPMDTAMALSKQELARRLIEAEQMLEAERIIKAELFKELEEANERACVRAGRVRQ